MIDAKYGVMLRSLCNEHYNRNMSFERYKAQRREILDAVDAELNGTIRASEPEEDITQKKPRTDQ